MIQKSEELKMVNYLKERKKYEYLSLKPWVLNCVSFFSYIMFGLSFLLLFALTLACLTSAISIRSSEVSKVDLVLVGKTMLVFFSVVFWAALFCYFDSIKKLKVLGVEKCQEMVDLVAKDEDVKRYRDAVVEKGSELLFFDLLKARQIVDLKTRLNESENVRAVCKKAHGLN